MAQLNPKYASSEALDELLGRGGLRPFADAHDSLDGLEQRHVDAALYPSNRSAFITPQQPLSQVVDEARLVPFDAKDVDLNDPDISRRVPQAISNPGAYGDAVCFPIVFAAAGDIYSLGRPKGTRIYLLIQNNLAAGAGNIVVTFGVPNTGVNGLQIPPGGNLLMDSIVAQNDVHVFSPAVGTVLLMYINADIDAMARTN